MNRSAHDKLILIKQDRISLFIFLAIYILLFCYGLFLFLNWLLNLGYILTRGDERLYPEDEAYFGIFIMLITTLKSSILIRDIFSPKVVLAYNDDGFCLKNGEFFIPWSDVSDVVIKDKKRPNHKYKQNIIALKFNNEPTFVRVLPVFSRLVYFIRKKIYNYGVWIYFKATEVNPTDVFSLFEKRCPQASVKLENY